MESSRPRFSTQRLGASAQQMGEAAELRTHVSGDLRKQLNLIVHSKDQNPDKWEYNPYKDIPGYDPHAQKVIEKARDTVNK